MFSLRRAIAGRLLKYAAGLRFPRLLALTLGLLVLDLVVPDLIPLADEILLGLFAALLRRSRKAAGTRPPTRLARSRPAGSMVAQARPGTRAAAEGGRSGRRADSQSARADGDSIPCRGPYRLGHLAQPANRA